MTPRRGFDLIPAPAICVAAVVALGFATVFVFLVASNNLRFPEAMFLLLAGTLGAAILAGVILLSGYVYRDAQQRGMPAGAWTALVLLVPNCIGFVLYFLLRKPLLGACAHCGCGVEPGSAFCPRCGAGQGVAAR